MNAVVGVARTTPILGATGVVPPLPMTRSVRLSPGLPLNSTVNLLVANGVMVLVSTVTVWLKSLSLKMLTPLA
jgi:hypothetical protein